MSSTRRLHAEIERTLKKVAEGIEEFDVTWNKVQDAQTTNLKEKYEAELKKEIKKLQKCRESIKSWASNSEVKDKATLAKARADIETEMERFKVLEREMKTKTYSKEGLSKAAREALETNPEDDPNFELYQWLDDVRAQIREQLEDCEAKHARHSNKSGRSKKKRNTDGDKQLRQTIERHQWHLKKLDDCEERLRDEEITGAHVDMLKEDVEYYIETNMEPDSYHDEFIYDVLDEDIPSAKEPTATSASESDIPEIQESAMALAKKTLGQMGAKRSGPPREEKQQRANSTKKQTAKPANANATPSPAPSTAPAAAPTPAAAPGPAAANSSASRASSKSQQPSKPLAKEAANPNPNAGPSSGATLASIIKSQQQEELRVRLANEAQQAAQAAQASHVAPETESPVPGPAPQTQSQAPHRMAAQASPMAPPPPMGMIGHPGLGVLGQQSGLQGNQHAPKQPSPRHPVASPSSGLGNTPRPSSSPSIPLPAEYQETLKQLEPSLRHLPSPLHSERPTPYAPRNPVAVPDCFPQTPSPVFDDPAIFSKFYPDTLFFIFFFQQGTPHQYLAARELKRNSWRYHKNFLTWFQRHDNPKLTTDEYEQGAYVYFDYDSGWCQRIKTDFRFEYCHLEDELSVPTATSSV